MSKTDEILQSEMMRLIKENMELEAQKTDFLRLEKPWATINILEMLIKATEILLNDFSYDGHSHEEFNICVNEGKNLLDKLLNKYKESEYGNN